MVLVLAGPGSTRKPIHRPSAALSTRGTTSSQENEVDDVVISTSPDLLRVVDISKSFKGNKVADNINIGVAKGAVFALLGPNGAGKTTTFNIIR